MVVDIRNNIFSILAKAFPTEKMEHSALLSSLWRILFYCFAPTKPFRFRTRDYEMLAIPKHGHLSRCVIRRGYWEKFETSLFKEVVKPGMHVIDGGANFGHYTLIASTYVGPTGKVIAFEPEPSVFKDLCCNVQLSRYQNIEAINGALADKKGIVDLTFDNKNAGGSSLLPSAVQGEGHKIPTQLYQLDHFLKERPDLRPLNLLKLDVQGAEGMVLSGAFQVISEDKPIIFCEFWPIAAKKTGYDPIKLLDRFIKLGYSLYLFFEDNQQIIPVSADYTTWPFFNEDDSYQVNMLLKM